MVNEVKEVMQSAKSEKTARNWTQMPFLSGNSWFGLKNGGISNGSSEASQSNKSNGPSDKNSSSTADAGLESDSDPMTVYSMLSGAVLFRTAVLQNAPAAERFKMLRAKIERLNLSGRPAQVIAVTSAVPKEGKSTIAVNLAKAFSEDRKGRTVIVDCDLRNPTVHEFFNLERGPGMGEILSTGQFDSESIHQVTPGLDVITAGIPAEAPMQLFVEPECQRFFKFLRNNYRYIIIDSPPVLLCSEAISLTSISDKSLLVVRAGRTKRTLVKSAIETIDKSNILGTVLNDEIIYSRDYSSRAYAGYYYSGTSSRKLI